MRQFTENRRKLKELILYVSQQCASKHNFGSVILYKILYFSDHFAYGKLGQPITSADYMKEKHGPIPRSALPAQQELESEGRFTINIRGKQKRPTALDTPDMSVFSVAEIALVDAIIKRFWDASTRKVRRAAHDLLQWRAYELRESIPYQTVYISPDQRLTRKEIKIGQEIARRRGWLLRTAR